MPKIVAFSMTCFVVVSGWTIANADNATPANNNTANQGALEEIVVTAQRREESLQHAAIAVTAIAGQRLGEEGVIKERELTEIVPALQIAQAPGPYSEFYLRGVGSVTGNAFSDSTVAINLDGVYISRPSSSSGLFYDINRLEVLKGPQGTLYGRNATGGAINIITNKPTDELSGEASIDIGNYRTKIIDGALNVPFTSTVSARLSVQTTEHKGYRSDGTDDENGTAGRLQVSFAPNDSFSLNTSADYYHQGGKGAGATLLQPGIGFVDGNPRLGLTSPAINAIYSQTFYFPAGNTFGPLLTTSLLISPDKTNIQQDSDFWGLGATANWKTDAGTLTVIPAYRQAKLDYTSDALASLSQQTETDKQGSLEARFLSNIDQPLTYLAGVYFLDEKTSTVAIYDFTYNASLQSFDTHTKSYAAFGRLGYAITDKFRLTGGVRFTDDKKAANGYLDASNVICPGAFVPPPAGPQFCFGNVGQIVVPSTRIAISPSNSWTQTTWRVGAEWDATPTSLLYGAIETGFKAGGFFFTHDDPTYQPEHITAFSLGSKNRFLENRLQLNGELFYWKYKDQQISHVAADSTGTIIFRTDNVGSAKMKGFELESEYLLTSNTLLRADVQYLDSVYEDYRFVTPNLGAPPATGCPYTLSATGTSFDINCSGNVPPQSPKWTANLGAQETIPVGQGSIVATLNTHFQTSTLTGLEFDDIETQHPYWITNATLGYSAAKDRWGVTGYVYNLADRTAVGGTFPHALAGIELTAATLQPPRTYGIRLHAKF